MLPETTPVVTETKEEESVSHETVEVPKWMAQNAGDNKTNERLIGFKTTDEISNAYLTTFDELVAIKDGKSFLPGENATDEEKRAYLTSIGVPESSEMYKKVDSTLPEGVGYSEEEYADFVKMAFESAWTDKQFASFRDWEEKATLARIEVNKKASEENILLQKSETEKVYRKEWGSDYDTNLNLMNKGVKEFGGSEFLTKLGTAGNLPEVINFLVEKGRSIKDDTLLDGELDTKDTTIPGQLSYPSMKGM